jgi:hypothetical protein
VVGSDTSKIRPETTHLRRWAGSKIIPH